jgi:antitoxin (DNA-binding transcriptional repressor) of toxin-antitoxin stability system
VPWHQPVRLEHFSPATFIARNGKPAARLVAMEPSPTLARIGSAQALFEVPECIDTHNAEVAQTSAYIVQC